MSYNKNSSSAVALALLFALVAVPKPTAAISGVNPVLAQSTTPTPFPLPDSVTEGTTVRIDGSNSMATVNQSLKQRFEGQYADAQIEETYNGTTAALQSLLEGNIDLAAIGRPLTDEEKAQGLTEVSVGRSKIAIIVGEANPFNGNLTFAQFAQIFRGEITDWSEVGGEPGPIRLIDQSPDSDTRQAFSRYPVFQNVPFETGATAVQLDDDSAEAIVSELGSDGISYITANQVVDRPGVRIVPMHQTLPTDPRYPYSQPLAYAYRGEAVPAVVAFLGFATAPVGQAAIAETGAAIVANTEATAQAPSSPEPTISPEATISPSPDSAVVSPPASTEGTVGTDRRGGPWLWLLPLLLGIPLLLWLLGRRRGTAPVEEPPPATPPVAGTSTEPTLADRAGTVISADRTSIAEVRSPAPVLPETPPEPVAGIPPVDPTVTPPVVNATLAAGAALGGAALVGLARSDKPKQPNRIILTPRTTSQAYAYWEAPEENRQELRRQGGKRYTLRVYDVTNIDLDRQPPHSIQELACEEGHQDRLVPNLQRDRDYLAEIGYFTDDNQWLSLTRSAPIRMPSVNPLPNEDEPKVPSVIAPSVTTSAAVARATWFNPDLTLANGQQETVEAAKFNVGQPDLKGEDLSDVDANLPALTDGYGDSQIFLLPRDPNWAYTYWDVPNDHKAALRREGGSRLALRFFDITGIDLEQQRPHSLQQYDCDELSRDWYLPVPISDRDYLVEIGYLTHDGRWLMLARSNPVRVPPMYSTNWLDDQFVTVNWQEDLRGKTQLELPQPTATAYNNPISDRIFNLVKSAEAQRVAGSIFGSIQQVPEQALSSYSVSGLGMAAQTESGIGMMSGIGVTGMSGVGVTGLSGVGIAGMSGIGVMGMSGVGALSTSGIGMSGVGIGVAGMSGIGMSGIGLSGMQTASGIGMSGVGMSSISMMSGIGISSGSGIGITGMSGVGMSGIGMSLTASGIGMSGFGMGLSMSGVGMASFPTMSGIGMSGVGMSGVGMSGMGMGYTLSGIGMSGIGMSLTASGIGMSGIPTMSGIGMSGVGMASIPTLSGVGYTMSGVGMSGVGMGYTMSGIDMSGIGMSGVGFGASIPPIRPRKFWLIANAELIVHGATEPDATVMVGDREIKLSPDGTFRFQVAFPDGDINYPVLAIAADGEQTRSIRMDFNRETPVNNGNAREAAVEEWFQ